MIEKELNPYCKRETGGLFGTFDRGRLSYGISIDHRGGGRQV